MTERRTLKTVAGSGGQHWGIYDLALDPARSTMPDAAKIAPRAEAAKIDALFLADLQQFGNQGAIGAQEPLIFIAALSQLTTHTGLITTVSSTFNDPYTLARQFGTLDHVSNGRAAWNVVTSAFGEENYGYAEIPSPEPRRPSRSPTHCGTAGSQGHYGPQREQPCSTPPRCTASTTTASTSTSPGRSTSRHYRRGGR